MVDFQGPSALDQLAMSEIKREAQSARARGSARGSARGVGWRAGA